MNHFSLHQLQFRKLLKDSIHSIKVELRSQTGELIPFVSVGLTRLNLLFRKQKQNLFCLIQRAKWLVVILTNTHRHRFPNFKMLFVNVKEVLGHLLIMLFVQLFRFEKTFFMLQKKIGKDSFEAAVPQIGDVNTGKTNFKRAVKRTAINTNKKQIGRGGETMPKNRRRSTK